MFSLGTSLHGMVKVLPTNAEQWQEFQGIHYIDLGTLSTGIELAVTLSWIVA